jgi:pimeloyl-ACP methyl ester carboxylesterase
VTTIDVGELVLDYERSGSGPPLLLIMGMSGTSLSWGERFVELLEQDFDVIAYDHRGVGASSHLDGPVTIAQLAGDAAGLLDALQLESAHVLGVSMGGMVAQELALAHPERVRTLTLGCTYCGGEGSRITAPEVVQKLVAGMMSGDRQIALRSAWEVNVSPGFAADEDAYAAFLDIAARRAVAVPVIQAQMQACVARLAELELPTLVVHGSEDEMLPVENGRQIASLIPGARLEILEGAGHLFWIELSQRSAELVRAHAAVPA